MPIESAKQTFILSPHRLAHEKVVMTDAFRAACDYSMLELISQLRETTTAGLPTDPYVGLDSNSQLVGARKVLAILKTIHEPIHEPKSRRTESLDYTR